MSLFKVISRADMVGAALVVAAGVFLVVQSPSYQLHRDGVMGPGFFPFWSGVALLIFGVGTAVGAVLRARRSLAADSVGDSDGTEPAGEPSAAESDGQRESPGDPKQAHTHEGSDSQTEEVVCGRAKIWRLSIVFGLTILAVALVPLAGIYVAFGAFVLILVAAVEREHWATSIAVAVGSIVVLYLIFSVLLNIPVPTGPWGF